LRGRRGLRLVEGLLDGALRVPHLALHVGGLRLEVRLERARRAFELGLHLAQVGHVHLAVDVRLHLRDVALQAAEQDSEGTRDLGQAFRADDDERHHGADHHLGEADVEHYGLRLLLFLHSRLRW
jgi:exonuclease VII small subunit